MEINRNLTTNIRQAPCDTPDQGIMMSNRSEPDDCRAGQFKWDSRSPDYDDSKERALEAYLDDSDNVAELIEQHADRLAVRFVCGQSITSEVVVIAQEMQKKGVEPC